MSEINIGKADSFVDPGRKVVDIDGVEIGVFLFGGTFTAFENVCPHRSGPACQGKLVPLYMEAVSADRTSRGREFAPDRMNIVCPWHGFEFDIRTGEHPIDPKVKLRPVPVRVVDGNVYVVPPQRRAT